MRVEVTPVFEKNWNAIHELDENGKRKYRYIINTGSSRSSKTYSLIDCYDLYARSNANKRMTAWRDTKKDCKDTVMNDFIKRLIMTERYSQKRFNKTESINFYDNGSKIEFRGTDEEGVFGLTQDCAWLNEPYSISKDVFDQIDQRTSDFIFIDWNPKEDHWVDDLSKHPRALVIHSTFKDNPFCPEEQRIKILSYEPTEENIANKTANLFKWQVYGLGIKGEIEGRIFKFEIIDLPVRPIPYGYGLDFGYTNDPTALIEAAEFRGGVLLHELIYETGLRPSTLSKRIFDHKIPNNALIVADRSEPLYIDELYDLGHRNIHAAEGDKSIVNGLELMKDRPIYVTRESINLIREMENYHNKKDKRGKWLNVPEEGQEDHAIDAARYISTDMFTQIKHKTY